MPDESYIVRPASSGNVNTDPELFVNAIRGFENVP
jgi:hypothetical protein